MKRWPFTVVDVDNKPRIQVEYKKEVKTYAPEQISAMVLEKMKTVAEQFIGGDVKGAVITVPAYFNNAQRQATMDAGKIAGLNVLGIINEPTAAALAYGIGTQPKGKSTILIFDLGGGTFDVSIVCIEEGSKFTVLATAGDTHLGGGDFDNLLVNHLAQEFETNTGSSISGNKKSLCKLKISSEETKQLLLTQLFCSIFVDSLFGGDDLDTKISQASFEHLCSELFRSTLVHFEKALADAKLNKTDIDEVVLVGGSTRIPKIQELLKELFQGKSLNITINPDEAVAYGAAVQAAILSGDPTIKFTNLVNDVTALSLGINVKGNLMSVVIPRNTRIPCNIGQPYRTSEDNQTCMTIDIYEGERSMTKDNHLLGSFGLTGIPPAPAKVESAVVTFNLDANGILKVKAVEKVTGKTESIVIQMNEKGLSPEEIERMLADLEKHREEDRLQRLLAETQLQLERVRLAQQYN